MLDEKAQRKRQRAALNSIREACVYGSILRLGEASSTEEVQAVELRESSFRDLEEEKLFVCSVTSKSLLEKTSSVSLRIEEDGEVLAIPLQFDRAISATLFSWRFSIKDLRCENRRKTLREVETESFFTPVLIYHAGTGCYPRSGFARVLDFDRGAIGLELRVPGKDAGALTPNCVIQFQEGAVPSANPRLVIRTIREVGTAPVVDGDYLSAFAVCNLEEQASSIKAGISKVVPIHELTLSFKIYFREPVELRIRVAQITKTGFIANANLGELKRLPRFFVVESIETKIRFNVARVGVHLDFQLADSSLGAKIQWFNFLTKAAMGFEYRFQPHDAKAVTRLMLESGNYSRKAINELVLLQGYLELKWPVEEALPKTKYRWLVRDAEGRAIGHTSGLRVSNRLWAAIDNIGSQSYGGSWNKEFVARWIRLFIELLDGEATKPCVQWTYNPKAGVWNKFDASLAERPDLLVCRDRIWSTFFANVEEPPAIERKAFSLVELPYPGRGEENWLSSLSLSEQKFLSVIIRGSLAPSEFCADFEHDYGMPFRRYFFRVDRNGEPAFLLTFSNYPDWASLNKTHNWEYLFPVGRPAPLSLEEEQELIAAVKEVVFRCNCTPFRIGIVDSSLRFSVGNEWTNLILEPGALEFAARTLDGP